MKLTFSFGSQMPCAIPAGVAALAPLADATALRVILTLAARPALCTAEDIAPLAELVGATHEEVHAALAFWQEKEVLTVEGLDLSAVTPAPTRTILRADDAETLTGSALAAKLSEDEGRLKKLLDECQQRMGRIFTPIEMSKVVALVENLGVSDAYVVMVASYCKSIGKTTVGYLVNTTYGIYNDGVTDAPKLEAYFRKKELCRTLEEKIRTLFGLGARTLTKKEKTCVAGWTEAAFPYELIVHAYEISADRGKGAAFAYIDTILQNWRAAGYRTLLEVEAAEHERQSDTFTTSSFRTDEFFDLALQRSYQQLGQESK